VLRLKSGWRSWQRVDAGGPGVTVPLGTQSRSRANESQPIGAQTVVHLLSNCRYVVPGSCTRLLSPAMHGICPREHKRTLTTPDVETYVRGLQRVKQRHESAENNVDPAGRDPRITDTTLPCPRSHELTPCCTHIRLSTEAVPRQRGGCSFGICHGRNRLFRENDSPRAIRMFPRTGSYRSIFSVWVWVPHQDSRSAPNHARRVRPAGS
jgi:hypothetical protein